MMYWTSIVDADRNRNIGAYITNHPTAQDAATAAGRAAAAAGHTCKIEVFARAIPAGAGFPGIPAHFINRIVAAAELAEMDDIVNLDGTVIMSKKRPN